MLLGILTCTVHTALVRNNAFMWSEYLQKSGVIVNCEGVLRDHSTIRQERGTIPVTTATR